MIRCIECGSDQYEGVLFCAECGAYILEQQLKSQTAVLPFSEFIAQAAPSPLQDDDLVVAVESQLLTIVIPHSRRRVQIEISDEIFVGRSDAEISPELDLASDDGAERGVSRIHASIKLANDSFVLVDLGSTNGTLLNGYRLPPDQPYPLKNGDEVRFGDLLIHVFFD